MSVLPVRPEFKHDVKLQGTQQTCDKDKISYLKYSVTKSMLEKSAGQFKMKF